MEKQHGKPSRKAFVIVIILFAVPVLLPWSALLLGQQDRSYEENRTLARFPALTWESFLDGSFQQQFEDALADQLPGGAAVKSAVLDVQDAAARAGKALLGSLGYTGTGGYEQITEGYYHYRGDSTRIVERPQAWLEYTEQAAAFAAQWAGDASVPKYLYFIENSRTVDFDAPDSSHAVAAWMSEITGAEAYDIFTFSGYEDFCARFYQTDHHWNRDGSYEGYRAVIRLLLGNDEPLLAPTGTVTTDAVFEGSYARQSREYCADELFSFYTFDTPRMKVLINGKKGTYGHMAAYEKGKYPTDLLRNHYSYCYGGDYARVEYSGGSEKNGTLLVIANSYSNAIAPLLASHFERCIFIDPRYYGDWAGTFDLDAFCTAEGVDRVLYLGDVAMFLTDEAEKGGEAS